MDNENYVIGIDFGTDSVRSIIIDTSTGEQISEAVYYYTRWKQGRYCDATRNQFRQHPLDYIEGLEISIKEALSRAPKGTAEKIKGLSMDTTGSTPVAVDKDGIPLALRPEFRDNPDAMFILWKDHTAVREAEEINKLAPIWGGEDYTRYSGGTYSSEWFWAKILHILRKDKKVRKAAFSWVEHCDWMPALLSGNTNPLTLKRSRCAAGHKAMWHESFGGLPSEEFLIKLDPLLTGLCGRLYKDTYTCDVRVGTLSREWAEKLGLSRDTVVGTGAVDAHLGAVGAQIKPYVLTKVMGTSSCDMVIAPMSDMDGKLVKGICGQVDGSIVPGMLGMEAGQAAFGDIYAWFKNLLIWPLKHILTKADIPGKSSLNTDKNVLEDLSAHILPELTRQAQDIPIGDSGIVALDWLNGCRTPYANEMLKGAIAGLSLGSDAPRIFRALVEATAFGSKKIIDCFQSQGVEIKEIIALGGITKKSDFVMQIMADVLAIDIKVARCEQACALGAAMSAAVTAGIYKNVPEAQTAMGHGFEKKYSPISENTQKYNFLYDRYSRIGRFVTEEITETE